MNFILPKLIFKVEKWKWNKEYRVYVSNTGKIKNSDKQIIPFKIGQNGYVYVITANGYTPVHRMVMKTWCPTVDMSNLTVDHLDHNKRNNNIDNLEWVTKEVNLSRAKNDFLKDNPTNEFYPNQKIALPAQHKIFSNLEEATDFLMSQPCISKTAEREKIRRRLQNAILNRHKYCGFYFTTNINN